MKHLRQHSSGSHTGHHDVRHHRTGRAAPWFVVAAVALIAAIVAGCGGDSSSASPAGAGASVVEASASSPTDIFDAAFVGACDGVGLDAATMFSQTPNVIHPVIVLVGQGTEMYSRSTAVRDAWTRTWTAAKPLALAEIELVACAERKSSVRVQECTGYEVDGKATDHVVNLNEAVYEVSLHEAKTGSKLAATTITTRDDECPMFMSFTEGEDTQEYYSFDDAAIQDFVEPYVVP